VRDSPPDLESRRADLLGSLSSLGDLRSGSIDEAHKCSAYTKRSAGRGDEVDKTKRYQLAEKLAAADNHLLLLTASRTTGMRTVSAISSA
jgi:hypothetical protein